MCTNCRKCTTECNTTQRLRASIETWSDHSQSDRVAEQILYKIASKADLSKQTRPARWQESWGDQIFTPSYGPSVRGKGEPFSLLNRYLGQHAPEQLRD